MAAGTIRVGVGGWDYDPWRGTFYPQGLPKTRQLEYAAERLTAIEVNATHYKLQKPELFERWARSLPDGFQFALKASRFCTNRKVLGEAGEAIDKFCGQGIVELGDRLGPILWQFMGTKAFDPDDFGAFLKLLPTSRDGVTLRHAVEPRHESFLCPEFVDMARAARVGIVFAEDDVYPCIPDLSGDLVYARLQASREEEPLGYSSDALDRWADIAAAWSRGEAPGDLAYGHPEQPDPAPRDTYIFFIAGAKVRNPLAAQALIERL